MAFVPPCLQSLERLSELNLAKNKLRSVPQDSLVGLRNLVMLDLHQNAFEAFTAVPMSKKLDTLNLAYNQIEKIENLQNAPNMTVLDLHNNKLKALPPAEILIELSQLKTLTISNNNLSDIDPHISLLPNLIRIAIEGNPLRAIKPSMRSAGAA